MATKQQQTNGGGEKASTETTNNSINNVIQGTGTYRDGLLAPAKDTRYRTEDVTDTKGRDFEDFFSETRAFDGNI
jgi:hypothetical protein